MPIEILWKGNKKLTFIKTSIIGYNELKEFLKNQKVEFAVAAIGNEIKWIPLSECFIYWKKEVKGHCVLDPNKFSLGDYPEGYVYLPSIWMNINNEVIILLEEFH